MLLLGKIYPSPRKLLKKFSGSETDLVILRFNRRQIPFAGGYVVYPNTY